VPVVVALAGMMSGCFDLITGAGSGAGEGGGEADFGDGFEAGLTLVSVEQSGTGDCANGGCGPRLSSPASPPCDNNNGTSGAPGRAGAAIPVNHKELFAFTSVE